MSPGFAFATAFLSALSVETLYVTPRAEEDPSPSAEIAEQETIKAAIDASAAALTNIDTFINVRHFFYNSPFR